MTDLEISKALALAIGWREDQMKLDDRGWLRVWFFSWCVFDYRDWNVIGPIAEKYEMFPHKSDTQGWWFPHKHNTVFADTPQKAIALAVIGAKK